MRTKPYGQYCGLSRALELVGERWTMLIVRDLMVGPRRYTDLRAGLARIPTNTLAIRLKELEASGIISRRVLPLPSSGVVYELTEYGARLEAAVLELARWGSSSLGDLGDDETVTPDALVIALRTAFDAENAAAVHVGFELDVKGVTLYARVDDGVLVTDVGELPNYNPKRDVLLHFHSQMHPLLTGQVSTREAVQAEMVTLEGATKTYHLFPKVFHLPPAV